MKMNTLKKLYLCLNYELPSIEVNAELAKKAIIPIERMLVLSK
jgi:quinolinate synthase